MATKKKSTKRKTTKNKCGLANSPKATRTRVSKAGGKASAAKKKFNKLFK
jgi:hypothetical protein